MGDFFKRVLIRLAITAVLLVIFFALSYFGVIK